MPQGNHPVRLVYILFAIYIIRMIQPEAIMRALADNTRLRVINLLASQQELCVCELTGAMDMAQPKVSRHLAILREAGGVLDRREGLWIYYRVHTALPAWAVRLLAAVHDGCQGKLPYSDDQKRLTRLNTNPGVSCNA